MIRKCPRVKIIWIMIAILLFQVIIIPRSFATEDADRVTIMFTHDMHSNLLPFMTEKDGMVVETGGYARLMSIIDSERESNPEALLLDAGDYSMGTPFQTIFTNHSPELRIMGSMGYDVLTLGNHEFDYRAEGLALSLNAAVDSGDKLPKMVQSNLTFPIDEEGNITSSLQALKEAIDTYGVNDYLVLERNGIRIGMFGLMGEESASMAPMSEVVFEDATTHAKRLVKILSEQEQVDLIICLSHSGTKANKSESEDEILAKNVPEIDVIISGHSHTKLEEPIIIGNTIIASSEEYGRNLGVMELSRNGRPDWKLDRYELVNVSEAIPEDETISQLVEEYKTAVEEEYFSKFDLSFDELVAYTPFSFPSANEMEDCHNESTLGNLISDAYIYAVRQAEGEDYIPVDVAIVPVGTVRDSFFQGDIRVADAFRVSSLGIGADKMPGYPLISIYLTGKELKAVSEVDASVRPLMKQAQLFISGMQYTFNPNRLIFNKVIDSSLVKTQNLTDEITEDYLEQIQDDKLYRVVAGLYSAQMLSVVGEKSFGLLKIEPKTRDGLPVTDYENEIIYETKGDTKSEVKEWYALVSYLKSFDKVDGVPEISEYYKEVQGRKNVENIRSITAFVSNPNHIALMFYGIILLLLAIIVLVVRLILRRRKRRKLRRR
ncbi:MAG: bifunctional metallophosphatase/5'-nucleotidase [Clostridiales bacterium]|jgi:2',3'-cyclic-nucleotide 2'-phosphodiesterase (5'-nucleotidase family)|nr:bifunctional metallophosphatase/5'-nucleotidase [Clostridiales bacterium]